MDATNEKKWFVYIGDKHEGPFSPDELRSQMSAGAINSSSYVWAEGMQDWKVMSDVPELASLSQGAPAASSSSASVAEAGTGSLDPKAAAKADKAAQKAAKAAEKAAAKEAKRRARAAQDGPSTVSRVVRLLLILAIPGILIAALSLGYLTPVLEQPAVREMVNTASDALRPHLLKLVEHVPALSPYISPIPRLEDVNSEEYEELRHAAADSDTPRVAVALSTADLLMPSFYVASGAPDGKQYRVVVTGIGDTLLNHTAFENSALATLDKRLGKTNPIRFPDGKPLPRGEYIVSVYDPDAVPAAAPAPAQQEATSPEATQPSPGTTPAPAAQAAAPAVPAPRPLTRKQYFLGGPKDGTYATRLAEYHDRIKAKAAAELAELKQFAATLEMQLSSTIAGYQKFRGRGGKLTRPQTKGWNDLHAKWTQLDNQLSQTFQKWVPENMAKDYFYHRIYQLTQDCSQAISSVHTIHHAFFTGTATPAQFDNDLMQAQTLAQTSLDLLKAKIEHAERLPPTPRGLPRRDGL